MKFYCVEEDEVWSEQEQFEQYEWWRDYGGVDCSYAEFMDDVLDKSSQGCITDELDTDKIAASAKLIAKWAEDFCGLGGACGKPDVEQFKALYDIQNVLEKIVREQDLRSIYEGV